MAFNNIPINGWPQISAEKIPFSADDFNAVNVKDAIVEASSGGGGGGTTVIANPEGSATDDLSKLQVGTTIYGIPAEAGDITYDNTSSGMTADDVQEAIDELNTGISGITELIPSDATSSNKLATASDIPSVATTAAPGIVQPDGTTITIDNGVISAAGGSSSGETYSTTETEIGTWLGATLYRKVIDCGALPNNTEKYTSTGINGGITIRKMYGVAYNTGFDALPLAYVSDTDQYSLVLTFNGSGNQQHPNAIRFFTNANLSSYTQSYVVIEYTKNS